MGKIRFNILNMKKKLWLMILFIAGTGGALWVGPDYLLPPQVTIATPHTGKAVEAVYATGTVEPTIMVPIAPRTTSYLTSITAEESQSVKKGDILAQLEDKEQQAALAELDAKIAFAESDVKRKEVLLAARSTSRDILETAQTTLTALIAQREAARAKAGYLQLVAPADGTIIRRDGEIGELISAGQAVFYFTCCAPLRITAEVDEEKISAVKSGQKVSIQADAFPDKIFSGHVDSVTPKGDPIARSYRVRIAIDDADVPFMIGMTTENNIVLRESDNALLIPSDVIGEKKQVQVVGNDNTIKLVDVKIGSGSIKETEITSGLTISDKVVSPFNPKLTSGDKVRVRESVKDK